MKELTFEQNRVFSFIVNTLKKIGAPPTIREIAENFGYKSINNVRQHLRLIEQKGYIRLLQGKARGIEVAIGLSRDAGDRSVEVPLIGTVAAGVPITAEENITDYITLDPNLFKGDGLFTLKIRGDSMTGAGILDGDIVIVRQQSTARNGEIVVAIINGEGTLKRYIHESDHVILRAENPRYEDIIVRSDKELWLAGKMVGIIRKY